MWGRMLPKMRRDYAPGLTRTTHLHLNECPRVILKVLHTNGVKTSLKSNLATAFSSTVSAIVVNDQLISDPDV